MFRSLAFCIKVLHLSTVSPEFLLATISGKFYKRRVMGQTTVPAEAAGPKAITDTIIHDGLVSKLPIKLKW